MRGHFDFSLPDLRFASRSAWARVRRADGLLDRPYEVIPPRINEQFIRPHSGINRGANEVQGAKAAGTEGGILS